MKTYKLLGYDISAGNLEANVRIAWGLVQGGGIGHYIACANPHSIVIAETDSVFSKALRRANILLPDGFGIILARRFLNLPGNGRVAGSEFFQNLSALAHRHGGIKYFFLGSTQHVLDRIIERLSRDYPSITVAGVYSPPFVERFSVEDDERMIKLINGLQPHILWVGMTAPKQEKWIFENRAKIKVPLIVAVGAVFDFYAGTKKRAPKWVQDIGLEWLPRLFREPRRLWERNVRSTPAFLLRLLKEKVKYLNKPKQRR